MERAKSEKKKRKSVTKAKYRLTSFEFICVLLSYFHYVSIHYMTIIIHLYTASFFLQTHT